MKSFVILEVRKTALVQLEMSSMHPGRKAIFAPINIPLHRRLQTFAIFSYLFSIPFFLSLIFFCVFVAFYQPSKLIARLMQLFLAAYAIYYWRDFKKPFHGRVVASKAFVRMLAPWMRAVRAYFPIKLVVSDGAEEALQTLKTKPRSLLFGSHPHGIIALGTVVNFILDPEALQARFPHISVNLLTLNMNMIWPFWRDWLMALGFASVDRVSCERILSKSGKNGQSRGIAIVVGGAKEALDALPGNMDLTLNSRNGFFKLALKHGSLLFPVITFGENDMYAQIDLPLVRSIQRLWHRVFGFSTPYFFGRGIFNYRFGWLPLRVPVTTVIGMPIDVGPAKSIVKDSDIQKLRLRYIQALEELYEEYKGAYEVTPCPNGLRIVN